MSGAARRTIAELPEVDVGDHPDAISAMRADPVGFATAVHRRSGPIARTRVGDADAVWLGGLEANQFVYADADQWDYRSSAAVFADQFGPTYLTSLDGPAHLAKRRQMAAGFRSSVLAENAPVLADEAERLLSAEEGTTTDLRVLAQRLVVHMSGRAVLGRPIPAQLAADIAAVERHLLFGRNAPQGHFDDATYLGHKRRLVDQLTEIIADRSWRTGTAETVLQSLTRTTDARPASTEEVVADLFLLLAAGSETTSAAITWGLAFLGGRPDWSERLHTEFAGWSATDGIDVRANGPLTATVLETERLRPPLPLQFKTAGRDLQFADTAIVSGTRVLHAACVTHQLPELFDDPGSWRPERFLDGTRHLPPRSIGTFGGTSHICLGLPLARLEQMTVLAVVARGWDVTIEGTVPDDAVLAPVLVPRDPVPARIGARTSRT